jgi:hypothetical protein
MTLLDAHNHINKFTTSTTLSIGTFSLGTHKNDRKILLMRLTRWGVSLRLPSKAELAPGDPGQLHELSCESSKEI